MSVIAQDAAQHIPLLEPFLLWVVFVWKGNVIWWRDTFGSPAGERRRSAALISWWKAVTSKQTTSVCPEEAGVSPPPLPSFTDRQVCAFSKLFVVRRWGTNDRWIVPVSSLVVVPPLLYIRECHHLTLLPLYIFDLYQQLKSLSNILSPHTQQQQNWSLILYSYG